MYSSALVCRKKWLFISWLSSAEKLKTSKWVTAARPWVGLEESCSKTASSKSKARSAWGGLIFQHNMGIKRGDFPRSTQGQVGRGTDQPGLVEIVPAHGRRLEPGNPFQSKPFHESMVISSLPEQEHSPCDTSTAALTWRNLSSCYLCS